jgi:hypothetical protein
LCSLNSFCSASFSMEAMLFFRNGLWLTAAGIVAAIYVNRCHMQVCIGLKIKGKTVG